MNYGLFIYEAFSKDESNGDEDWMYVAFEVTFPHGSQIYHERQDPLAKYLREF